MPLVALRLAQALATLDRTFWRVSDPDSSEYGK